MTARVLAFPAQPRDRGRLLTPQEAADILRAKNARWVLRNVTPRAQLSARKILFWEADVLAFAARRTA